MIFPVLAYFIDLLLVHGDVLVEKTSHGLPLACYVNRFI